MSSAFKSLYSDMIRSGGSANVPKKTIKCYVKESFPHFLVTDGFFYVACYFTKKAVDEFHSKFNNVNISDLRSRVLIISDWSLEMAKVNSSNVFTSYGGCEVKLIVRSFKVTTDKDTPLTRHPVNLFRDEEIKTLVNAAQHAAQSKCCKDAGMPAIGGGKGNVSQGITACGGAASFKTGNTATVDMNSIFKQEKGADALRKVQAGPAAGGKVKVSGGAKGKGKKKAAAPVKALMKSTPGAQKKSTTRVLSKGGMASPGGDGKKGTTDNTTMRDFKKMMKHMKKNKKK
jgi:hypothetical protein